MPGTVSYLNHEPVAVLFGSAIGSVVNLGFCAEGDITVTLNSEWVPQLAHQTGGAALEAYYKGGTPQIEATLSEINNWDLWETVLPTGEKMKDTATPPAASFSGINETDGTTGRYVGQKATTYAKILVLRPVSLYVSAAAETVRDWVFPKAFCSNVAAIPFSVDTPNAFTTTWTVLFDPNGADGRNQWYRGLTAGTWSPA